MQSNTLQGELLRIERELWTSDAGRYRDRLSDDAMLLFEETGLLDRAAVIAGIEAGVAEGRVWSEVTISEARVLPLSETAALLTYKVVARLRGPGPTHRTYATSVYVRAGEDWKLAFHQQTGGA